MKKVARLALIGLAPAASILLAWQGGIALAGWTENDLPRVAKAFLVDNEPPRLPGIYLLRPPAQQKMKAMGGPARARVVTELAQAGKTFVSAREFEKMYDQWIASRYNAVNHNLQVSDKAATSAMLTQSNIDRQRQQMGAANKTQVNQKAMAEQRAYNEHKLKVQLRSRLQAFLALARSVDFAAQTRDAGGKKVFVKPDYERQHDSWKTLYRLGKEPTLAAITAAEAWLKEL